MDTLRNMLNSMTQDELLEFAEEYFGKPFEYYTGYEIPQLHASFEFENEFEAIRTEIELRGLMEMSGKDRDTMVFECMGEGLRAMVKEMQDCNGQA